VAYFVARGESFSGEFAHVNGDHVVPFCRLGMVWAVVSLGARDTVETLGRGWRRIRAYHQGVADSLLAYVEIVDDRVAISEDIKSLDQTERSTLSNWYGLAFTRFCAARLLGIAWLRYVDSQRRLGIASLATKSLSVNSFRLTQTDRWQCSSRRDRQRVDLSSLVFCYSRISSKSRKRGDLVGLDYRGDWHVLESKGRYGFVEKNLELTAKGQATNVLVNQHPPKTASSCVVRLHTEPVHAT